MLRLSDSRNFGRTLAALGLIGAALLFLIGTLLDPAWADGTEEYLNDVAADKGRYLGATILNLLAALLLVPGLLGVIHLLRRRRVTIGQIGAGLVLLGAIAIASTYAVNVIEIKATDAEFERSQMVKLLESTEESAEAIPIFILFIVGLMLGSLLLAFGLWRQKAVPVWVPVLLVLGNLVNFGEGSQAMSLVSSALIGAALVGMAMKILSVSDADWERWEVLGPGRAGDADHVEKTAPSAPV